MTLNKAIEILEAKVVRSGYEADISSQEALQLGIEGLKMIKGLRNGCIIPAHLIVPGETEE